MVLTEGVHDLMRKLFALFLALLLLLSVLPALSESAETSGPKPTLEPEVWRRKVMTEDSPFDFTVIETYDELPPVIEGQHHYLLLCLDQWERGARPDGIAVPKYSDNSRADKYGNTDGICLLTLDTRAYRIMLTSIIRDAIIRKVNLDEPVVKHGRINRVYNDYGPEALCQIISQHLGIRIEKYIMFTFRQIANIVDYMGGVQLPLSSEEVEALRLDVYPGTLTDPNGNDITAKGRHPAGLYTFKTTENASKTNSKSTGGVSAVLYMRIHKTGGDGDFMRTQRARNVLSKLADKCRTMTWDDAKALVDNILENNNKTNLNLDDMIKAAEYAMGLQDCTIEEFRVPSDDAKRSHHFANMSSVEINWGYVREQFADYLQNSFLVAADDDDDDF